MSRLGVNIDHIATLRNARGANYPSPIQSLKILEECQVDQVTCHLREDRRHIKDDDLKEIIKYSSLPVNMEMALTDEMIQIACDQSPHTVTLVPEKREEVTTEGGLDLIPHKEVLKKNISILRDQGIRVSLFIDPDKNQIEKAIELEVPAIELHTGCYCEAFGSSRETIEFDRLKRATEFAVSGGLKVFAGHGLNWVNLKRVTEIREIEEYNIGHSIIARAVFLGLKGAVEEIQEILN